jgi:hypothetical protein
MLISLSFIASLDFSGMTARGEACANKKGVFEVRSSSMTAQRRDGSLGQNNEPNEI